MPYQRFNKRTINNNEPKTSANNTSVVTVEVVITNCSPSIVVVDFQTSFGCQFTAYQSHCQQHPHSMTSCTEFRHNTAAKLTTTIYYDAETFTLLGSERVAEWLVPERRYSFSSNEDSWQRRPVKVKGKADDLCRGSMQFENHRRTALQYPLVHWTLCRCHSTALLA